MYVYMHVCICVYVCIYTHIKYMHICIWDISTYIIHMEHFIIIYLRICNIYGDTDFTFTFYMYIWSSDFKMSFKKRPEIELAFFSAALHILYFQLFGVSAI